MKPADLLATARRLALHGRKPRQSDLRRSASTTYDAIFHAMCATCADTIVGTSGSDRSNPAWRQAYRAVAHGYAKSQCKHGKIARFPKAVEDFASAFVEAQEERHKADDDPFARFTRSEALLLHARVDRAIRDFGRVPLKDRRAFAVFVALRDR